MELRQEPAWSVPQTVRKPGGLQRNELGGRVQAAEARGPRGEMGAQILWNVEIPLLLNLRGQSLWRALNRTELCPHQSFIRSTLAAC